MPNLPYLVCQSIYDIDFNKLYEQGKRFILSDLDNTIISYQEDYPCDKFLALYQQILALGFKFYIISNNNQQRVKTFVSKIKVDGYLYHAFKPHAFKIKKFIKKHQIDPQQTIAIGDQIVTDLFSFTKCGLDTILVKSIEFSSQKWYTKINRLREKKYLKIVAKNHQEIYQQIIKEFYE